MMVNSQKVSSGLSLTSDGAACPTTVVLRIPKPLTAAHCMVLATAGRRQKICTYLFEVEENWVEAEEHEGHSCGEPAPCLIVERICIEPGAGFEPTLGLVEFVHWIRCGKDEGVYASQRSKGSNVANCIVEAHGIDEVT